MNSLIFEELLKKLVKKPGTNNEDDLGFHDNVVIKLIDPTTGEVVEEKTVHNTWLTYGRNQVRDALADGGFTAISYMYENSTSTTQPTSNDTPANYVAEFEATWPAAGAISGITSFSIRQSAGGSNLASISISSLDKPNGLQLTVTWQTTVNTS